MVYYTVVMENFNDKSRNPHTTGKMCDTLDSARRFACRELVNGGHPRNYLAGIYRIAEELAWTDVPPKKNRVGEVHRWADGKFMYYHEHPVKYRKAWVNPRTGKIGKGMW